MTLQEIFDDLGTGEFSNLGIVSDSGVIDTDQRPRLIRHINLALSNLYSRFNLRSKEESVYLSDNQTTYTLIDNDALDIREIYNDLGEELFINYQGNGYLIRKPTATSLEVQDVDSTFLSVRYRAKHPQLDPNGSLAVSLQLPEAFRQALLYYVGYRVNYNRMKEGSADMAADMKNRYEAECLQLQSWGLTNEEGSDLKSDTRFYTEGWA